MVRKPLSREEVIKAIERKGSEKIPLVKHKWWGNGLRERYGSRLDEMASAYPDDILEAWYTIPGEAGPSTANPDYRWGYKDYNNGTKHSIGETCELLPDW